MASEQPTVLFATHIRGPPLDTLLDIVTRGGYQYEVCDSPEAMLELVTTKEFSRYYIEANLGHSGTTQVDAAAKVYELLQPRIDGGDAKIMFASATHEALDELANRGVPREYLIDKPDDWKYLGDVLLTD